MTDREAVVKGLETCSDVYYGAKGACSSCPYCKINGDICFAELVHDAIVLLKEQEPVEPIYGLHGERHCGNCRNSLWVSGQRFCASCGRAVKWDG